MRNHEKGLHTGRRLQRLVTFPILGGGRALRKSLFGTRY